MKGVFKCSKNNSFSRSLIADRNNEKIEKLLICWDNYFTQQTLLIFNKILEETNKISLISSTRLLMKKRFLQHECITKHDLRADLLGI